MKNSATAQIFIERVGYWTTPLCREAVASSRAGLRYNLNRERTKRTAVIRQANKMIIYDLICEHGHRFEGWFKAADDFARQERDHMLSCPVCGAQNVSKLPTASRINTRSQHDQRPLSRLATEAGETLLEKFHRYVDDNYDDVGSRFPEEARKIHYGETEARNIHGTASLDEINSLHEEGISATPLPVRPAQKEKLN